jgi:hypothetical protein
VCLEISFKLERNGAKKEIYFITSSEKTQFHSLSMLHQFAVDKVVIRSYLNVFDPVFALF